MGSIQRAGSDWGPPVSQHPPFDATIGEVVESYLDAELDKLNWKSRPMVRTRCQQFAEEFGSDRLVSSIRRIEIVRWLTGHKEWKQPQTRKGVIQQVGRAFSWALDMDLISSQPFRRIWKEYAAPRSRVLTDAEIQTILRNAKPYVRRLLMFLQMTGCRPGEAVKLRWANVDLDKGVCVLRDHKTFKRTGRPRTIVLIPELEKLLDQLQRGRRAKEVHAGRLTIAGIGRLLRRILRNGPVTTREVREQTKAAGVSPEGLYKAAKLIGSVVTRRGKGRMDEYLPPTKPAEEPRSPTLNDPVFTNERNAAWTMYALTHHFHRLRKRAKLSDDVTLYCYRHTWATTAIKNDVPIKMVSELLGHSRTAITEAVYVHVQADGFLDTLRDAASKARTKRKGKVL